MFTTREELKTHMNVDSLDVITGSDDTLVTAAIDGAVAEARGYLSAFDADSIFSATGSTRHALLLTFVKDIAVWHLIALSNYQADIALREKRYDRAVSWLKGVQKGDITPDLPASDKSVPGRISYGSNEKREQHF
jgi:phage gp36-like protein